MATPPPRQIDAAENLKRGFPSQRDAIGKAIWPTGDGERYEFFIHEPTNDHCKHMGVVFIFAYLNDLIWRPVYVGITDSPTLARVPHWPWTPACLLGATHVHVRLVADGQERESLALKLIELYQPTLNQSLRYPLTSK